MGFLDFFKKKVTNTNVEKIEKKPDSETPTQAEDNEKMDMKTAEMVLDMMKKETMKPVLRITLTGAATLITGSKVGGLPYLPADADIPLDSKGMPLRMLAQIDCRELSALPDFPHNGLLQFWIGQDDSSGLFTDGGNRVIWFDTVNENITEEDVRSRLEALPQPDDEYFPVKGEYGINLTVDNEPIPLVDAHFPPMFIAKFNKVTTGEPIESMDDLGDQINEMIWNSIVSAGHKISGYPFFTQWDPREENDDRTVLLLQLDSEYLGGNEKIMWGDAGVCGFFCTPDELKKRNFSNVLYNWDCG